MRLFVAARARFAEDALAHAVERGVRQAVVLGAGLDTFAYRLEAHPGLRSFEIDHPSTQAEKRRRLAATGIAIPAHLTYAPCDFETSDLGKALAAAGFDPQRRAVFLWLGVVPYLTDAAIFATLGFIAALPGGGEVVCDYANPASSIGDPRMREAHRVLAERVAAAGEALQTFFETIDLHERARALGFREIEDWGPHELSARFFPERAAPQGANGGHVLRLAR